MEQKQDRKAAVIGAGLVGCLAAAMLAKQGWSVDLYESRAGEIISLVQCDSGIGH